MDGYNKKTWGNCMNRAKVESLIRDLLSELDENIEREGLLRTPERVAAFWEQFSISSRFNNSFTFTTFSAEGRKDLVGVYDIPFYSMCEHHMLPFFGRAHVGYVPNEVIAGLSKIPRTVDYFANRLQNQERITYQVADFLVEKLNTANVMVVLQARHLCMEMRGVKKAGESTESSAIRGLFSTNPALRTEFMHRITAAL